MKNLKKMLFCLSAIGSLLSTPAIFSMESEKVNDIKVATGIKYAIRGLHYKESILHLNGQYRGGGAQVSGIPINDPRAQWIIEPTPQGNYAIRGLYYPESILYLDGTHRGGTALVSGIPIGDSRAQWTIEPTPQGNYAIRSLHHSDSILYLNGENRGGDALISGIPINDSRAQWAFIPSSYKLKAVMSDFEYLTNVDDILNRNKKTDFMGEYHYEVGADTVGSNISRTFEKNISSSFSWGLNEKISITTSLEIDAGIPLIGGAKTTVSMSAEFGSDQNWSSSKEVHFSATDNLIPQSTGIYKMSGWVETAENVELPFKANILFTATGDKLVHGETKADTHLDAAAIEYLIKFEDFNGTIIERNPLSILASVTGTMKGNYGMSTFTKTEKIG